MEDVKNGDKAYALREMLLVMRSTQGEYHNHKENITYLALGLSLGASAVAVTSGDGAVNQILRALILFGLILNHGFILSQRIHHYTSALLIQAIERAVNTSLSRGISQQDLELVRPSSAQENANSKEKLIPRILGLSFLNETYSLQARTKLSILQSALAEVLTDLKRRPEPTLSVKMASAAPLVASGLAIALCMIVWVMRI